jgi:hypothetical protein
MVDWKPLALQSGQDAIPHHPEQADRHVPVPVCGLIPTRFHLVDVDLHRQTICAEWPGERPNEIEAFDKPELIGPRERQNKAKADRPAATDG